MGDLFATIVVGKPEKQFRVGNRKSLLNPVASLLFAGILAAAVAADAGPAPEDLAGPAFMVAQEGEAAPAAEPAPAVKKPVKKEEVDVEAVQKEIMKTLPEGVLKVGFTWYGAQKQFVTVKANLKIQGQEADSYGLAEKVARECSGPALAASPILERVTVNVYRGIKKIASSVQKQGKELSFEWMGEELEVKAAEQKEPAD